MKNYIYRVYFNLKDNNKTGMCIDVYANSKNDAKKEAQKAWYTNHNNRMSKIEPHCINTSFNGCYYPDGNPSIKSLDFPNGTKWHC